MNIEETKKYMTNLKYNLPIDFVLPLFNWGLKFSNKQFNHIVYNVNRNTFDTCKAFSKQANGYYKLITDYYTINQNYFYFGDEIRIEDINKNDLLEISHLCLKQATSKKFTVSFFELNPYYINSIDSTSYEEIYRTFH